MLRIPIKIMTLVVCVFPVVLQGSQAPTAGAPAPQTQAAAKSPSMAPNTMNPVHPTPESQARAKTIYGYDCAMCHGVNGDGKGDLNRRRCPTCETPLLSKDLPMVIFTTLLKSAERTCQICPRRTVALNRTRSGTWLSIFGLFRNHRIQQRTLSIPFRRL